MSGDRLVARRIAEYDGDIAIRGCLQALFTQELDTADQAMPHYKGAYEAAIRKHATAWQTDDPVAEGEL